MGDIKNFINSEAVEKLRDLAQGETCMFCTYGDEEHIETRPMATQEVDDEGNIWFFSAVDSKKNGQIGVNDHIYLHYSNTSKQNYLSIEGRATIVTDRELIKQKWTPIAKAWF